MKHPECSRFPPVPLLGRIGVALCLLAAALAGANRASAARAELLPKVRIAADGRSFQTDDGSRFEPFGVTYYRPGTGWAPQLWKQFDADATRADLARMKELGLNCVRVFLSYGSFLREPDTLAHDGLAKFDQFLDLAERAGLYVHPTGPDHWEGTPDWAKEDRVADERVLNALALFWKEFAARYRGRHALFAYDLLNEPAVGWNTEALRTKWNVWLEKKYGTPAQLLQAWGRAESSLPFGQIPVPEATDNPASRELLDYQLFREEIADDWTGRQVAAIKSVDPDALVSVGFIQWSVPALLPRVSHYSGFRPARQARHLDFLKIHFYPLAKGFYEYASAEDEARNLAYLESVVREVAAPGKPVVIGEFGWYGGGQLTIDQGKHPAASEEQQARWCQRLVETTRPLAVGWLNWGFYDHPQARDVSQLTGLLTVEGRIKAWGEEFRRLAIRPPAPIRSSVITLRRPALDWDLSTTSVAAGNAFREEYFQAYQKQHQ